MLDFRTHKSVFFFYTLQTLFFGMQKYGDLVFFGRRFFLIESRQSDFESKEIYIAVEMENPPVNLCWVDSDTHTKC